MNVAGRLMLVTTGSLSTRLLLRVARTGAGAALQRRNYRGATVSLRAGPVLAVSASTAAYLGARGRLGRAALIAGLGSGAAGLYDDIVGGRGAQPADKGFKGHLRAAAEGRLSTGLVKLAGIGGAALLASRAVAHGTVDTVVTAGVIAGTANVLNLLDLRPGRALKAGVLLGLPLAIGPAGPVACGPVGAAAAALPEDLAELTMIGDTGANALGALLGLGLAAAAGPHGRLAALAVVVLLTMASERVSFTEVIERAPGLRQLDALGRHPVARRG